MSLFFKNSRTLLFLIWFVRALSEASNKQQLRCGGAGGQRNNSYPKKDRKDGSPHAYYIYFCPNSSYFHLTFFFFHKFQSYWTFKLFYFSYFKYFWFIRIILIFSFRFSCPANQSIRMLLALLATSRTSVSEQRTKIDSAASSVRLKIFHLLWLGCLMPACW